MTEKSKIVRFTKKQKANILDILIMFLSSFLILLSTTAAMKADIEPYMTVCIAIAYTAIYFIFVMVSKINNIMWEYATSKTFLILTLDVVGSSIVTYCIFLIIFKFHIWMLIAMCCVMFGTYFFILLSKLITLQLYSWTHKRANENGEDKNSKNTLIIGAGWSGSAVIKEFQNDNSLFNPVCIIDDDYEKHDKIIMDVPVVGTTSEIKQVVEKYKIKKIVFAIPSCDKERRKKIIADCVETKCVVRVVPPIQELIDQSNVIPQMREVKIEDLLGREPMTFDETDVHNFITGKRVLVTGGGGSIGSELCRQIASFEPAQLVIMDIYENNAYDIQQELKMKYPNLNLVAEICSIADYDKCRILFDRYKPELVYHAAAHKHVPLMEHVPEQAIKNNVVGTLNLCKLALEFNVDRFLLISTDKAVNPTNVMGASKRCCEMIVKYHSQISTHTTFCAVRFGNVLGSNGSVIPLFKRQIANGGPVTLTDRNIIRYFMTIPEAVSLVLQTSVFSENGEIFVLDMGEPVKILDLAENLIRLSGYTPYKDIDIVFTGLRPGEKLFEELLINGEGMRKTSNKKIFICKQIDVDADTFIPELDNLISLAKDNKPDEVVAELHKLIPTYHKEPDAHL